MKFLKKSTLMMLAMGLVLFACSPDNVAPHENGNGAPGLAGAVGDPHPALDTVCQTADTMFLVREDNGSPVIDKCYGPGGPITCAPGQMPWGYLEMVEGYVGDTNYIDCNFTMAPGWYCKQNDWRFSIASAFQFSQNGIPIIDSDWSGNIPAEANNKWQLRINTTELPNPCYDVALRVTTIKLNLFGAVVNGSETVLWGRNRNWNVTGHPAASASQWLQRFCPLRCMNTTPPPTVDTTHICEVVYTGLTCTGNNLNSTTLHPVATETSGVTYLWSHNGATTQDITVSPTTTTSYTVAIKVNGVTKHIVIFDVNVVNVACTITSNGGGGNGGSGSGSGNGSGGSGSGSGNGSGNGGGNCGNGGSGSGSGSGGNGGNICGDANQVISGIGCSNNSNILGAPNNSGTLFTNTGHKITLKLDHTLPAGTQYQIRWKRSGSGNASLKVSESATNATYTQNGPAFTTNSSSYVTKTLTTIGSTRYLRLESTSSVDFYVDAITYCYAPPVVTIPGVKVCHVPPGNPGGATTICVSYAQLSQHVTGVCSNNGGGGNGGSGSGSGSGGSGSGHNGSGNGSGGSGGGNGHGCGGHTNNCNGHHHGGGCNNGHSGSGGSGSGSNAHGWGSHHGGGCQGNQGGGHTGDMIGACNSNPCL